METQKDLLSADTLAAIEWLGMPEGSPFPLAKEESFPHTEAQSEQQTDDPTAWKTAFASWLETACVQHARSFGHINCLHLRFCEWTVEHSTVAPCTRQTFERLLTDADYLIADGFASGLILQADFKAAVGDHQSDSEIRKK